MKKIGQTEYKISMPVKSRPKPEGFSRPEDTELFREAINEVNKSATSSTGECDKICDSKRLKV